MFNITLSIWSPVVAALCVLLLNWLVSQAIINYRIQRSSGVRASILAGNPLSVLRLVCAAAWMQANNRLLEFAHSLFRHAKPSSPHCVELAMNGRRYLFTTEPEHIKAILSSKFGQFGKGKQFHDVWSPLLGDSIFTTDGQMWQSSRTLIRPMFTKDRMRDLDIFDHWTNVFISKFPAPGQTVDVCDLFYRLTLDVITDFLLGRSVESLSSPNGEFATALTNVQRLQMILTLLAPVAPLVRTSSYNVGIKVLEKFIDPFIRSTLALSPDELEKRSKSDKGFTFLHNIALMSRDPKVIRDQIMGVLIAGRDTTASTLSWTLYELSNYPEIWQRLRSAVLEKVGPTKRPSYEDIKGLTDLTNALCETLRLYPAIPYNVRACTESTTLPSQPGQPGIAVFKDDLVAYSPIIMQRRSDLYPATSDKFADPKVYSPQRWEHWTPKPWHYVPFNGGPRICIGQNFSMTEMVFILVRLLQKYERVEYKADWTAQFHKTEIAGCPGQGVPVTFYEATD